MYKIMHINFHSEEFRAISFVTVDDENNFFHVVSPYFPSPLFLPYFFSLYGICLAEQN